MANVPCVCADCQKDFVIVDRERRWFEDQGLALPKRCKPCREYRKQQRLEDQIRGQ